ncbi:putative fungal specific transcription factor domain-containing protein [Phaeomoniella chlamydospora]|uniref:Putative fungal specific transcription factor domain-containing protein n=1 Tax=Phaeomoniella chlamydospora TaxID=158046 RepID=A0A0G2ESD6_PHACM|nr:putative fungal specific transcription factor domain-containing protein [Phaeomoniella chlamydospora]
MEQSLHRFRLAASPVRQSRPPPDGKISTTQISKKRKLDQEDQNSMSLPACERCRRLKKRCSKSLPKCDTCIRAGRQCSFAFPPPEGSTRVDLEARIRLLSHHLDRTIHEGRDKVVTSPSENEVPLTPSVPCPEYPRSTQSIPTLEEHAGYANAGGAALTSGGRDSTSTSGRPAQSLESSESDLRVVQLPATVARSSNRRVNDTVAHRFVDAYFRHVHRAYPFMNKSKILSEEREVIDSTTDLPDTLFLIMAIGCTTLERAGRLPGDSSSSTFNIDSGRIVQGSLVRPSIRAIETLVLLSLWSLFDPEASVWTTVGVLTRQAIMMGLSRNVTDKTLSSTDIELRHRLSWSIFVLDRMVSCSVGLPVGFKDTNMDVPLVGITVEEFAKPERDRLVTDLQTCRHVIQLRQLEETVLEKVHLINHCNATAYSRRDKRVIADNIRSQIDNWYSQACLVSPTLPDTSNVPFHSSVSWLSARYYNLLILLYCPSQFNQDDALITSLEMLKFVQQFIRSSHILLQQRQLPLNWITLYRLVPVCLILLWCFGDGRGNYDDQKKAFTIEHEVTVCSGILDAFPRRWAAARRQSRIFGQFTALMAGYRTYIASVMANQPIVTPLTPTPSLRDSDHAWLLKIRSEAGLMTRELFGNASAYEYLASLIEGPIEARKGEVPVKNAASASFQFFDPVQNWDDIDLVADFL